MFNNCTSLTTAPELPATTLATSCYYSMFNNCTSLTTAPELPATTLAPYCYSYMFSRCTSLTTAPELPATTLAPYCYYSMFNNCTSLTIAPELPATNLASNCYQSMFKNCINLQEVTALFTTDISNGTNYTSMWLSGVAPTGVFYKNPTMKDNNYLGIGTSQGVPEGWTIVKYGDSALKLLKAPMRTYATLSSEEKAIFDANEIEMERMLQEEINKSDNPEISTDSKPGFSKPTINTDTPTLDINPNK